VLHRAGYKIDPNEIMSWAMTHGWSNRGANEFADVARGVLDGRSFRVAKGFLAPGPERLTYWKEKVNQKPTK
jgi:uncharacterized protein YjcR